MKNKIVLTLLGLVIVSGVFSGYIYNRYKKAKKEVVRLCDNQRSLLSEMDLYRTKDSLSAASVERLQLTNREFERYCSELKLEVEELGIRVKGFNLYLRPAVNTSYPVYIPVRDSIRGSRYIILYRLS